MSDRGPTDGAMISPYGDERDYTDDELGAWLNLDVATALVVRIKACLSDAASLSNAVNTALQDAFCMVDALLKTEIPGAIAALNEG